MHTPPGYKSDGGVGWFMLYIAGGLPLGILFIIQMVDWGPLLGLVLVTYFWWPTWWQHARGDYRKGRAVRRVQ